MEELHDPELLASYLTRYRIQSLFDTQELPFRLYRYETGEMMNILHSMDDYLKFVVEGTFRSYSVNSEGNYSLVREDGGFCVLGDMALCGIAMENHYHEVTEPVLTVELPLYGLRETLMNDNRFLRHLIRRLGEKLSIGSRIMTGYTLEEALLYHLQVECPDHRITSVEDTAFRLNYSRSQLQRVLRNLTVQGILEKQGRGTYQLRSVEK